jgi:hypothetical protein
MSGLPGRLDQARLWGLGLGRTACGEHWLERIRQLEEQSRFSFLNAFVGRIMGLVEHVALCATGGRWPKRENGTEVDRV